MKLTVRTPFGVFTRTTKRTYSHFVVSRWSEKYVQERFQVIDENIRYWNEHPQDPKHAVGLQRQKEYRKQIESRHDLYFVNGWCGRMDLALKLHAQVTASGLYRDVKIFDVSGNEVV